MALQMASNLTQALVGDHTKTRGIYASIQRSLFKQQTEEFANQLIWEIARHSAGEEVVVYPLYEKYLENGVAHAEQSRKEHNLVKQKLLAMDHMIQSGKVESTEFRTTLDEMMTNLVDHMNHEETDEFPKLDATIPQGDLDSYAMKFEHRKMIAPTRPHPGAPDSGGMTQTLAALLTAPIDKIRDMFKDFPSDSINTSTQHRTSA